jgi:hypothetical protein
MGTRMTRILQIYADFFSIFVSIFEQKFKKIRANLQKSAFPSYHFGVMKTVPF